MQSGSSYVSVLFLASTSQNMSRRLRARVGFTVSRVIAFLALCSAVNVLLAQVAAANFGSVNIGSTSTVIPLTFTFSAPDTLASTAVLTQGATGLDYADAGSDTCTVNTAYSAGQSCTVNVTFTPKFAGIRSGAVVLEDGSGNTISTGTLQGVGIGPQIIFQPGSQSTLVSGYGQPASVVVDGYGDIFFTSIGSSVVFEMVAVNGTVPPSPTINTIGSGFGNNIFIAMDGAGNLYVADMLNSAVDEIMAVNGTIPASPTIKTLATGFSYPIGIAVDGSGNVYVVSEGDSTVKEIVAVDGAIPSSPAIIQLGSGFSEPIGIAVDSSGDVYIADSNNNAVKEIVAATGNIITLGSGFYNPYLLALDGSGNLYVADYGNNAVKEIVAVNGNILPYPSVEVLGSGFITPVGVAADPAGNVYVADFGNSRVEKLDFADPPSLNFASTAIGAISADSPQTISIQNAGNAVLTFPIPSAGNNPNITTNFTLNSGGASNCPLLSVNSPEPATLAAGASCQLPISFAPTAAGTLSGSLVLTDNNLNATASNSTSQSIALNGTATGSFTLTSSASSLTMTQGGSGTSTITVNGQNGFDGAVSLSASGLPSGVTASFSLNPTTGSSVLTLSASSTSSLASSQSVTITGNSGGLTESTTILLTVNPANFTVSSSASSLVINPGTSGTATITVNDQNGFAGNVSLAFSGLPGGVSASFSPNPTNGTSVLTLNASSTAVNGTYYLTIMGTSGTEVASAPITVNIVNPSFTFASVSPVILAPGSTFQRTIAVTYWTGINGSIALTASGLPTGVSASFSPNPISPASTTISMLTLSADSSVTPGTYNVAITGTYGSLNVSTNLVLTVPEPTFGLSTSVASGGMEQGTSLNSTITVMPEYGFAGNVELTATNLPNGVTASFSPNPTANNTSVLTINASSTAAIGDAEITITGTAGDQTASTQIDIGIVAAPPSFWLTATGSITLAQGASASTGVWAMSQNGFSTSVNMSVSSLPPGVTASFNPTSVTTVATSTLTLTAASTTPIGTYNIIVTGTSSGLPDQTVTIPLTVTAPPPGFAQSSVGFGAVNIGTTSPAQTLTYTFGAPVTLGSTAVLTQGATGSDFANAGTGTCVANTSYTSGQSCTVNALFTPIFSGTRNGAVVLNDTNGNVIATAYLHGTAVGPQIGFAPATQQTLGSDYINPMGTAVDGSGNIYIADETNGEIKEIVAVNGRIPSSPVINVLGSGFNDPRGVAVDGAGNVFVADYGNGAIKEILAVNGSIPVSPTVLTLSSGLNSPWGIAVDTDGNVVFTQPNVVEKIFAVGGSIPASPESQIIGSGFNFPIGVAVDSNGNIYIADSNNGAVKEVLAVNGGIPSSPTIETLSSNFNHPVGVAVDGVGDVYVSDSGTDTVSEMYAVNGSVPVSSSVVTLSGGFNSPNGLAVDGGFNVYIADTQNNRILELDYADPPSLTFASTSVGSNSADSPQTVMLENVGNAALSFPVPSTSTDPSIGTDFILNSDAPNTCPVINNGASAPGTLPAGASCALAISFSPSSAGVLSEPLVLTDNNLNAASPYVTQSIQLTGTGTASTPTINWPAPAAITYDTPLSLAQLNATASEPGTFSYFPAIGTVLGVGTQAITVTFTPTDTTDYTTATATVSINVTPATPTVTWPVPAPITYGTALSSAQLDATTSVAGAFTYSPVAGTVLSAGTQTLSVTFSPSDSTDYTTWTTNVPLTVNKAIPTISWSTPASIVAGTPLSSTQLDAAASVPGTFAYSPAAGTVLAVGNHTLTTIFAPTDSTNYNTATASVPFQVIPPPPSFSLRPASGSSGVVQGKSVTDTVFVLGYNGFNSAVTLSASGLPPGVSLQFGTNPTQGSSVLTFNVSNHATPGTYAVTVNGVSGSLSANTMISLTIQSKGK